MQSITEKKTRTSQDKSFWLKLILFLWLFTFPIKNVFYHVFTLLIILTFAINIIRFKHLHILQKIILRYKSVFLLLFSFYAITAFATLTGISGTQAYIDLIMYFFRYIILLFALLYFYQLNIIDKRFMLQSILIVLSLHALNGTAQHFLGYDPLTHSELGAPSLLVNGAVFQHNPFGLLMATGAIISLSLLLLPQSFMQVKHEKILYFFLLFLFLFNLFYSQSRSSWTMFSVYLMLFSIIYIKRYGLNKQLLGIFVLLSLFSFLIFISDPNLIQRLEKLLQGDSAGRVSLIWPFTIKHIEDEWLLGYGLRSYTLLPGHHFSSVHNLILEMMLYTGIVGTLIFSIFIATVFRIALEQKETFLFALYLVAYLVLLQFDGSLLTSKIHLNIFYLTLFFILASPYTSKTVRFSS